MVRSIVLFFVFSMLFSSIQAQSTYLYEIELFEEFQHTSRWTEKEKAIQQEHLEYLTELQNEDLLILGGVQDQGFADQKGIVILRVQTYERAMQIAQSDPAVLKGMMKARVRPFNIYFREGLPEGEWASDHMPFSMVR